MTKSSKKGLQKLAAMASAAILASMMAVPMAWAASSPGVEGDSAYTGKADGQADSNIHLIVLEDEGDDTDVISVTAPTDIYLAAKTDGTDKIVDLETPSKGAAKIQNLGSNPAKVASWTVSAGAGLEKKNASEETGFWASSATDTDMVAGSVTADKMGAAVADSYWLQAYVAADQSDATDIAIDCATAPTAWKMLAKSDGGVGDHLDLGFVGQIRNPTKAYYESNPVIDTVTWTFSTVS